jgi:hypothetical protein
MVYGITLRGANDQLSTLPCVADASDISALEATTLVLITVFVQRIYVGWNSCCTNYGELQGRSGAENLY